MNSLPKKRILVQYHEICNAQKWVNIQMVMQYVQLLILK